MQDLDQPVDQNQPGYMGVDPPRSRLVALSDLQKLLENAQNTPFISQLTTHEPHTPAPSCMSSSSDPPLGSTSSAASSFPILGNYPVESEEECEECLETYRTKMIPFFPVVVIRPTTTVREMREQRPFLWLVIRAICSKSSARQRALGLEVRKALGKAMLVENTKSLDLFLGILVFVSWGHYYLCKNPVVTAAIQLGMSLAADLGITRPARQDPIGVMLHYSSQGCPKPPCSRGVNPPRTMEDRRAGIGLFLISSV